MANETNDQGQSASAAGYSETNTLLQNVITEQRKITDDLLKERKSDRKWSWIKRWGLIISFAFALVTSVYGWLQANGWKMPTPKNSVAVVDIKGPIGPGFSEKVNDALTKAFEDTKIKAIELRIDSPGGSPVEAEQVYTELEALRKKHPKQVIAVVSGMAASAAYMIAIHADRIVSNQYGMTGSIGAIITTWNWSVPMDKVGVINRTFASGPLKDMLNPYRAPNQIEAAKANSIVAATAKLFREDVAKQRGKKLKKDIMDLATGEVWTAPEAKELGLIDSIGTVEGVARELGDLKIVEFGPDEKPGISRFFKTAVQDFMRETMVGFNTQQQGFELR